MTISTVNEKGRLTYAFDLVKRQDGKFTAEIADPTPYIYGSFSNSLNLADEACALIKAAHEKMAGEELVSLGMTFQPVNPATPDRQTVTSVFRLKDMPFVL